MEEQTVAKKKNRKIPIAILFIIGLMEALGFFDVPMTKVIPIEDKYVIEAKQNGDSYIYEKHNLVFKISYRNVDATVSEEFYDLLEVGDELLVEYKVPLFLVKTPYVVFIKPIK